MYYYGLLFGSVKDIKLQLQHHFLNVSLLPMNVT